jgi:hypothetical protein
MDKISIQLDDLTEALRNICINYECENSQVSDKCMVTPSFRRDEVELCYIIKCGDCGCCLICDSTICKKEVSDIKSYMVQRAIFKLIKEYKNINNAS